jgi:uncharacterized C2H2 Zn-finger protein
LRQTAPDRLSGGARQVQKFVAQERVLGDGCTAFGHSRNVGQLAERQGALSLAVSIGLVHNSFFVLTGKNVKSDGDSKKSPTEGPAVVKCPKCGHEFHCNPGWLKVSATIGCPKCAAVIQVRKEQAE